MQIVIDVRTLGSRPSGVGIYTVGFLKELLKRDHEIILLTDVAESEEIRYLSETGVPIIAYGERVYQSGAVFRYFRFVRSRLLALQPQIFWEPNAIIAGSLKGFQGKTVITLHDMFPMIYPEYFGRKYSLYFRLMAGWTIHRADLLIYNSHETEKWTEKCFMSARRKQKHIGYIIVESGKDEPAGECSGETAALVREDYFLYVGNMEKRKGVDILIRAYERYVESGGTKKLYLVGKRRERDIDILLDAASEKLEGFLYIGYAGNADKRLLYEQCSCFLFPSRAEGFGIGILEAMQYKKPVIASKLPIFEEVVGECINYFEMDASEERQIANLCESMLLYKESIDHKEYGMVLERYSAKNLGENFCRIFETLK